MSRPCTTSTDYCVGIVVPLLRDYVSLHDQVHLLLSDTSVAKQVIAMVLRLILDSRSKFRYRFHVVLSINV